jgi:hypothetical protein
MSKPYIKINSASHSGGVLGIDYTFLKLRGNMSGGGDITILGLSDSISFYQPDSYTYNEVATFSVPTVAPGAGAAYSDPSAITWTFAGVPNGIGTTATNAKYTLAGVELSNYTASTATLSVFLTGLVSSFVFGGTATGFSALAGSNTVTFNVPANSGNTYNSTGILLNLTQGTASIVGTASSGLATAATFSGGSTTINLVMSTTVGGYMEGVSSTSFTASVL